MSVLNLTKKEKISLAIIALSLVILILSIGYFSCFSQERIEIYFNKRARGNYIYFNNFIWLSTFFSTLIFSNTSRHLTFGSLKLESWKSKDELVIKKNYEIFKLTFNIFFILAIGFLVFVLLNDNLFNHIFSYKLQDYLANISNGKPNSELDKLIAASFAESDFNFDKKLNAAKAICILLYIFPLAYSISSLLVWFKYKKIA